MASITAGLTPQQKAAVDRILAPSRKYGHDGRAISPSPNMEGWFLFRTPSTLNPPTELAMRWKTGDGVITRKIWITRHGEYVYE